MSRDDLIKIEVSVTAQNGMFEELRIQLKTNRSIDDCVFVDIHKLGKHTCKTL